MHRLLEQTREYAHSQECTSIKATTKATIITHHQVLHWAITKVQHWQRQLDPVLSETRIPIKLWFGLSHTINELEEGAACDSFRPTCQKHRSNTSLCQLVSSQGGVGKRCLPVFTNSRGGIGWTRRKQCTSFKSYMTNVLIWYVFYPCMCVCRMDG